jgi:hypothetical protein
MIIAYVIGILSDIVWLFAVFRQIKTNYFYFFLVLAVSVILLLNFIHPARLYLVQGLFLIVSLYNFRKIPYYIPVLLFTLIIAIILAIELSIKTIVPFLIVEHLIIFFIILKRTVIYSYEHKKLNVFHFVLLLFEITAITRFIVVLKNQRTGIIFFYIMAAFGIFLGIFFLFYNEKNSPQISLEKGVRSTE